MGFYVLQSLRGYRSRETWRGQENRIYPKLKPSQGLVQQSLFELSCVHSINIKAPNSSSCLYIPWPNRNRTDDENAMRDEEAFKEATILLKTIYTEGSRSYHLTFPSSPHIPLDLLLLAINDRFRIPLYCTGFRGLYLYININLLLYLYWYIYS